MKQTTFASAAWENKGKVTRRERFLAEMDAIIPLKKLARKKLARSIRRHYPKAGRGRQPHPLETMLRIHCLQHFFNLSDPAAEEALYDSESMRRFVGLELDIVGKPLDDKGLIVKSGTIVDATIIAAPPSTKNRARARGEHPFRVIKQLWGFTKVRYRGIAKNLARA